MLFFLKSQNPFTTLSEDFTVQIWRRTVPFCLSIAWGSELPWSPLFNPRGCKKLESGSGLPSLSSGALLGAKSETAEKSSIAFTSVSELGFHLELCPVITSIWSYQLCLILSWHTMEQKLFFAQFFILTPPSPALPFLVHAYAILPKAPEILPDIL